MPGACAVCWDPLVSHAVTRLHCGHAFHSHCARRWGTQCLRREREPTCPLCRVPMQRTLPRKPRRRSTCYPFCVR